MQHLITLITADMEASSINSNFYNHCPITFELERLPLHIKNRKLYDKIIIIYEQSSTLQCFSGQFCKTHDKF